MTEKEKEELTKEAMPIMVRIAKAYAPLFRGEEWQDVLGIEFEHLLKLYDKWNKDKCPWIGYVNFCMMRKVAHTLTLRKRKQRRIPDELICRIEDIDSDGEIYTLEDKIGRDDDFINLLIVREELQEVLSRITDKNTAQILMLNSVQDISITALADALGVSRLTIYTRINKIREELKKQGVGLSE